MIKPSNIFLYVNLFVENILPFSIYLNSECINPQACNSSMFQTKKGITKVESIANNTGIGIKNNF
jgi:hypothetical protein